MDPGHWLNEFIDEGSLESHKYYKTRRTLLEMLKDRGFAVPDSDIDISLEQFRDKYGQDPDINSLKISVHHKEDPSNKILALFCSTESFNLLKIRSLATMIGNQNLSRLILIVQSKVTNQVVSKCMDLFSFKVEFFQINDLLVNITKHKMMPKQKVLSAEEKEELLENYKIDEKTLPRMSETDAIAKYYGLEKGQIVKTTYSGEITQSHTTYRLIC